jgi:hypothetical protein
MLCCLSLLLFIHAGINLLHHHSTYLIYISPSPSPSPCPLSLSPLLVPSPCPLSLFPLLVPSPCPLSLFSTLSPLFMSIARSVHHDIISLCGSSHDGLTLHERISRGRAVEVWLLTAPSRADIVLLVVDGRLRGGCWCATSAGEVEVSRNTVVHISGLSYGSAERGMWLQLRRVVYEVCDEFDHLLAITAVGSRLPQTAVAAAASATPASR